MNEEKVEVVSRGMGFWSALTLLLIALKLCGVIEVSWWVIAGIYFVPLFLVLGILTIVFGVLFLIATFTVLLEKYK